VTAPAGAEPRNITPVAVYYLSQTDIARELGVSPDAVRAWRKRYPSFPGPDAWTGLDEIPSEDADARVNPRENARAVPGWLPSRMEEIRTWRKEGMSGQGARSDLG
jgi:uncharacterized protein YjcR